MRILFILISFLFLSACQNANQDQNLSQNNLTGVIGGELVAEKESISYGIVGIYDAEDQAICTGSLISPNHVLTAAHCIGSSPKKMQIIFNVNLDKIIGTKNGLLTKFFSRKVTDAKVHPSYKPEEQEDKEFDYGDIAIIKFEGDLPEGYHAAQLLSDNSLLHAGTDITVAGFGVSDVYTEPVDVKKVKNLQDAIYYGEIFCYDDANTNCVSVEMGGDGQLRQTHAPISSLQETEFLLDESKGHGTCSGDSGGPAYVSIEGQLFLTGVTSRGSALCDNVGVYTNVIPYIGWINETMPLMK